MTLIERTPYKGDEIQLFELTPEEVHYFNDRDNISRRWSIIRRWIKLWLRIK